MEENENDGSDEIEKPWAAHQILTLNAT